MIKCPICLSRKNEYNEKIGETCCTDCGLVLTSIAFEETSFVKNDDKIILTSEEKGRSYVNQVRERAKNSPRADSSPNYVIDTYNSAWTDASTARKAVRHERRIELGMEGKRLFDIRRWGNTVSTLNAFISNEGRTITPFSDRAFTVQSKHSALPIPLNAIDQSAGALSQNPGY